MKKEYFQLLNPGVVTTIDIEISKLVLLTYISLFNLVVMYCLEDHYFKVLDFFGFFYIIFFIIYGLVFSSN